MNNKTSITTAILKRSFRVSANVSLFLFIFFGLFMFTFQINQQRKVIEEKITIDSELLVNALNIGDLFFIKQYLTAFVESRTIESCGLKENGQKNWLSIAPGEDYSNQLDSSWIQPSLMFTTIVGSKFLKDNHNSSWKLYYSYKIQHFFIVYVAVISFILSIFIFLLLSRILRDTATFFSEPIENLNKDLDAQLSNPTDSFKASHYKMGSQFKETDRLLDELNRLLLEINIQKDKIKDAEIHKALARLGRQVSHDIQSPLGALNMAIQQIDQNREKAMQLATKSIERISNIVSDLKINKEELDKVKLKMESINFNQFIENLIHEKEIEYGSKVDFKFKPSTTDVFLKIDQTSMARAISNIINNGVEAVKGVKPIILLEINDTATNINLAIQDNGSGIPKELENKIFEYGFSFGKSHGTGTGLSQANEVIKKHNGVILLGNESVPGKNQIIICFKK